MGEFLGFVLLLFVVLVGYLGFVVVIDKVLNFLSRYIHK